jgi:hypothetical protein
MRRGRTTTHENGRRFIKPNCGQTGSLRVSKLHYETSNRWSNCMLKDIVEVQPLDGHRLHLRFEDKIEGVVDIAQLVQFTGVFAPLAERDFFARVRADPDLGTIVWPNGADLDPDVLYALVANEALPLVSPLITGEENLPDKV